jgi:CheY-like chemotaxis protein
VFVRYQILTPAERGNRYSQVFTRAPDSLQLDIIWHLLPMTEYEGHSIDALARQRPCKSLNFEKPALRILVIDDDECVGTAIQAILARRKHEAKLALRACDGIQALELTEFDAVVIDLFLPGMSGLDTIAHIRRRSAIPIVAISGFRLRNSWNAIDYVSMAMQRGASTFIRKPFAPEQLVEAIDQSIKAASSTEGPTQ